MSLNLIISPGIYLYYWGTRALRGSWHTFCCYHLPASISVAMENTLWEWYQKRSLSSSHTYLLICYSLFQQLKISVWDELLAIQVLRKTELGSYFVGAHLLRAGSQLRAAWAACVMWKVGKNQLWEKQKDWRQNAAGVLWGTSLVTAWPAKIWFLI